MASGFFSSSTSGSLEILKSVKSGEKMYVSSDGKRLISSGTSSLYRAMYNTVWGKANRVDVLSSFRDVLFEVKECASKCSVDLSKPYVRSNLKIHNTMSPDNRQKLECLKDIYSNILPYLQKAVDEVGLLYESTNSATIESLRALVSGIREICSNFIAFPATAAR
jgi:bisphosphoglycerate-dependent phosphoglycerate mutase